jgi:hypothetical protein
MLGLSALFGALAGLVGLLVSYHANLAAGGTIVLAVTIWFGISLLVAPRHGYLGRFLRPAGAGKLAGPGGVLAQSEGQGHSHVH